MKKQSGAWDQLGDSRAPEHHVLSCGVISSYVTYHVMIWSLAANGRRPVRLPLSWEGMLGMKQSVYFFGFSRFKTASWWSTQDQAVSTWDPLAFLVGYFVFFLLDQYFGKKYWRVAKQLHNTRKWRRLQKGADKGPARHPDQAQQHSSRFLHPEWSQYGIIFCETMGPQVQKYMRAYEDNCSGKEMTQSRFGWLPKW